MKRPLLYVCVIGLVLTGCSKNKDFAGTLPTDKNAHTDTAKNVTDNLTDKARQTAEELENKTDKITSKANQFQLDTEQLQDDTEEILSMIEVSQNEVEEELTLSTEVFLDKISDYNKAELLSYAKAYMDRFNRLMKQYNVIADNIKNRPVGDAFTEEGEKRKKELAKYKDLLDETAAHYDFYIGRLKDLGVEYKEYGLL